MENTERTRSLALLYEAGARLSQTLDLDQVYQTLRDLLVQAMDCDELIVSSVDAGRKSIRCEYYHSWTHEVDVGELPPLPLSEDGSGAQSRVIVTGKSMIIPNYHIFMRSGGEGTPARSAGGQPEEAQVENRSAIVVPMKFENKVVGVVQIFSYRYNAYSEADYRLAEAITNQMAAARNNAILYRSARMEVEQRRQLQEKLEQERALLERRVAERTADLAQALRVRDEFLSNMSHELRTPLASIQGFSELLQYQTGSGLSAKHKRYLDLIYQNSEHLIHMVNDLLDMAKIATGEMQLHKEWTALESIYHSCLHYAEGRAMEKSIQVSFANHCPVQKIYCDPRRTRQLLNNLLNNAVKYTPESYAIGFEIKVGADEEHLEFIVWDQGIGMAQDQMARVFEPFAHLQASDDSRPSGMGVGLAMAKRMAELQGGTIELRSQANQGTVVVVSLPIGDEAVENGHGETRLLTPEQTGMLRRLKEAMLNKVVVVADRDPAAVELLEYYLEIFNVNIRTVTDVEALRSTMRAERVDLLIVDITLPGLRAAQFLRELRSMHEYASLPVIATCPIQQAVDQAVVRSLKANDFLVKPFHFSELGSKIRKYMG
ncbi:MAG: response regulator [Anaerolineae bacterium]|nr:response regulator [Anaerolineae bacterium]